MAADSADKSKRTERQSDGMRHPYALLYAYVLTVGLYTRVDVENGIDEEEMKS
jgi:hypothetical protein